MSEWTIVTVIASLVGLFVAIGKPILSLNTAIVKLQGTLDTLMDQLRDLRKDNAEEHEKFDARLDAVEKKVARLEEK